MNDKLSALRRNISRDPKGWSRKYQSPHFRLLAGKLAFLAVALVVTTLLLLRFGGRFLPATSVVVETVLSVESHTARADGAPRHSTGTDPFAGTVQFQSSGWIEADPFKIKVTALVSGVVEQVHFLEGQAVKGGDVLVTLIREDAHINLLEARHALDVATATVEVAKAERSVARARLDRMASEVRSARGRLAELTDLADRAQAMGAEVIPEQEIVQALLRVATQTARVESMESEREQQRAELERAEARVVLTERMADESRQRLARRELEWARTEVRAPQAGIIQRLFAVPGQKRMLTADDPESATVAWIYDPARLQARIDVPLVEAAGLFVGQAVLVESELLPGRAFKGVVTRIVGEADLQRNTLQVKVALRGTDGRLRPEMLCRAKFLDTAVVDSTSPEAAAAGAFPTTADSRNGGEAGLTVFVPRAALNPTSGSGARVFVVDVSGKRVEPRELALGSATRGAYVEVLSGLNPGDRVVVENHDGLKPGSRIKPSVKGEEER